MISFALPSLGADMDEGTLLEWRVSPGDHVTRGQVIAVVDTSKAAVDVEIWQDGVVDELLVEPGQKIPVGTAMATLREPEKGEKGEKAEAPEKAEKAKRRGKAKTPEKAGAREKAEAPEKEETPEKAEGPAPTRVAAPEALVEAARHPVSPAARRRGRELDVDVEELEGSGPGGAVTIADVEKAAAGREGAAATPSPPSVPATPSKAPRPSPPATAPAEPSARQREMRRAIAAAMSRSKREIPHYYLSETVPMAQALEWLGQRNAERPITERVLPAVLQLKAVALALRRTPELNGHYRDGEFAPSAAAHVGVAISLRGGGLVAPAIHDVAGKSLDELMRDLADLVKRARAGSLRSSEMSDPTITVTNLGDQGVDSVAGVIYPPQVALVGFGRIAERPWVHDGWLKALPLVTVTLSADHRVSDGHRGAVFLAALREQLQHPAELDAAA